MYRSILVPLDGSRFGEAALPYALRLARRTGARIHLVQAHEPVYLEAMIDTAVDEELRRQARAYLESVADGARRAGVTASARLLVGRAAEAVARHIEELAPDLVVMTTHGRGGMERWWLGSVTDTVLRRSRVPILAVRPVGGAPDRAAEPRIQRILVPLDGSRLAHRILRPARRLAEAAGSDFDLVSVVMPPFAVGTPYTAYSVHVDEARLEEKVEETGRYLRRVASDLEARGFAVRSAEVVVSAEVAPTLLRHAVERRADVVAIATHGRHGLGRFVLGSVADKVIRGSLSPVLAYRPAE